MSRVRQSTWKESTTLYVCEEYKQSSRWVYIYVKSLINPIRKSKYMSGVKNLVRESRVMSEV
jgi:hypothetical protein